MGWIRWTGKTLEFVGKLAQTDSFEHWAESKGEQIITNIGLKTGGYLFSIGKNQKAKNLVWNELQILAKSSPELGAAINAFVAHYPNLLDTLASHWDKLPHTDSDLSVIPRFLLNRDALIEVTKKLGNSQELASLKGGASLREYFFQELVHQLDMSYSEAASKASPERPLELNDRWIVGFNPNYQWKQEAGHYFVYSSYSRTSKNAINSSKKEGRQKARELLTKCLTWLGQLSLQQRKELEQKLP
jgi:hypothetical protein